MIITYKNYLIKAEDGYNLTLLEIKKGIAEKDNAEKGIKKGDEFTRQIHHGFFNPTNLSGVIKKIIVIEMAKNNDTVSLAEAVEIIQGESKKIEEVLKLN